MKDLLKFHSYIRKWLTIVIIAISFQLSAQKYSSFPTANATWCTDLMTWSFSQPVETYHYYSYYKTNGDTIIGGKTYTVIEKNTSSAAYCFLREENNTVFCKMSFDSQKDTSEFALYDFNVHVGDTVMLPIIHNYLDYYQSVVIGEDSVLIGADYHRRITIYSWVILEFIEGIGSIQGLLYPEIPLVDWGANLNCFSLNDTIFKIDGSGSTSMGNCYQQIGFDQSISTSSLTFYPNPVSDKIFISSDNFSRFELYNSSGQCLRITDNKVIDLSDFPAGVYYLKAILKTNSQALIEKIIKY